MRGRHPRARRALGSLLLLAAPLLVVGLLSTERVRGPLVRVGRSAWQDVVGPAVPDVRLPVEVTAGVAPGDPVYRLEDAGARAPIAYVVGVEAGRLRVRFVPGGDAAGPWRLHALPPPRTLGDAVGMALPAEARRELGRRLGARVEALLEEAVLPEIERRLPDVLARLDPGGDSPTGRLLDAVGADVVARLEPFLQDLGREVARDLDHHLDLLDRLGLLWRFVRSDLDGIKRRLLPRVTAAAEAWWARRRDDVLAAVGEALAARWPDLRRWLAEEAIPAVRTALVEPVLEATRPRLEADAQAALQEIADAAVLAPDGGFRLRFVALVRARLLGKDAPLLLLERVP